jgi:uncharacterized protein (DUF305 family)
MRVTAASTRIFSAVVVLAAPACSPQSETRQNTAAATGDTNSHNAGHSEMSADANHAFLEKMVDHHEGLILLAGRAERRGMQSITPDAKKLHTKQQAEQQKMAQMMSAHSGTSAEPTLMPRHKMMSDSLERQSGKAYERGFYQDVIAHHKEGIAMIDSFLPRLTDDSVRTMAEKMRTDQEKEIAEFSKKAGTS